jgi:glycosyltransferase involved in cell wall biosynthesis
MSTPNDKRLRVLYSFPHKIGADRICTTAWYQVASANSAGADVACDPGVVHRVLPAGVRVRPTLGRGRARIPYRLLGSRRAFELHDAIVARRLRRLAGEIDVVHTWPLGARRTLEAAAEVGIPSVLERPNANTRFAYTVVKAECERLGIELPPGHEHAYNESILRHEEEEYDLADYLLCPSDFVRKTFVDAGYSEAKLLRHIYGVDPAVYFPPATSRTAAAGLTMLIVGVAAVRKGQHIALEAWLRSSAAENGKLLIVGGFVPSYRDRLESLLAHPSVEVLGHRNDVPDLMRKSDVLLLPSLEEGFGLVCTEAMATGCVPLVSDACTDLCRHGENALVHRAGDVETLAEHMSLVNDDRRELERLRAGALATVPEVTWDKAGAVLVGAYRRAVADYAGKRASEPAGNRRAAL